MATSFSISIKPEDIAAIKALTAGIKDGAPKALSRAINDTIDGARTDMVQQVYDTYELTKTRIRDDFKMKYSNFTDLTAKCAAVGKPIRLAEGLSSGGGTFNFKAEAIRTGGVRYKFLKNGSLTINQNAFFAIMPNGHAGFFQRQYRAEHATSRTVYHGVPAAKLPWKRFYPGKADPHRHITELTGPAVEDAFRPEAYPSAMPTIEEKVKIRMDTNMGRQIDFEWSKF